MFLNSTIDPARVVGKPPESLTLEEQTALTGKTIALEVYTPESLPLRRIEAIGDSAEECIGQLAARGLDPTKFEFSVVKPPY
jgi:hypothetical protein